MACSNLVSLSAALGVCLLLAPPPAHADSMAGGHELVVLAEPAAPASPEAPGPIDLTLTWTVREVFAGEPASVTIAVHHEGLEPAQVRELANGGRFILLADRDDERPGRWRASMPLRATPSAIEAFRSWGAPSDVRPERDLGTVVAEVRGSESVASPPVASPGPVAPPPVASSPSPAAPPAASPGPAGSPPAQKDEPSVAEGPLMEEAVAELPEAPVDRDAAPSLDARAPVELVASSRWAEEREPSEAPIEDLDRPEQPAVRQLEREPESPVHIAELSAEPEQARQVESEAPGSVPGRQGPLEEPPLLYQPALQPRNGPGLPPPPPDRPLGPALEAREDLKKAKPRSARDA